MQRIAFLFLCLSALLVAPNFSAAEIYFDGETTRISASGISGLFGRNGRDEFGRARDGWRGSNGMRGSDGADGRNGGDGADGGDGSNAGFLHVNLEATATAGEFRITGYKEYRDGSRVDLPETILSLSETHRLLLLANGGSGGQGGAGGRGQDGGNGGEGGDASRFSRRSGDGGNGGNGGDAGESGDGGNGGDGGEVHLYVGAGADVALPFVEMRAEAGNGGSPGRRGWPGRGGNGGNPGDHCYFDSGANPPRQCGFRGSRGFMGRMGRHPIGNGRYGSNGNPGAVYLHE